MMSKKWTNYSLEIHYYDSAHLPLTSSDILSLHHPSSINLHNTVHLTGKASQCSLNRTGPHLPFCFVNILYFHSKSTSKWLRLWERSIITSRYRRPLYEFIASFSFTTYTWAWVSFAWFTTGLMMFDFRAMAPGCQGSES